MVGVFSFYLPARLDLRFPAITPSGFSIGISFIIIRSRRDAAFAVFEVRYFINPCIIHDAEASLGCTRADIIMYFLFFSQIDGSVIVSIGTSNPLSNYFHYSAFCNINFGNHVLFWS